MDTHKRREIARAEAEGYVLIVFHETWDDWDDPEARISERITLCDPRRGPIPTPGEVTTDDDRTGMFESAVTEVGGRLIRDGNAQRKRHNARLEARAAVRAAETAARKAKITDETERVEMGVCPECQEVAPPEDFNEPTYECSRCGGAKRPEGERARCDDCHIFMAKVTDLSCPSCETGLEEAPDTVTGVEIDGEFIPETEIADA